MLGEDLPAVVGFLNLKGGVGKTHVTIMTALALVKRGYKVLIKDFDPQGSISEIFLGWHALLELERRIVEKHGIDTGFKLTWLMLSEIELNRYMSTGIFQDVIVPVETDVGKIDIFPVLPKHYADTFSLIYSREETRLYEFFSDLDYDYILVDLPPQPIPPTAEVLKVIDVIISPILYNHESSIRPAQLLLAKALLNKEVVKSRLFYGKTIPSIPGTVVNMVSRKQVNEDGVLKPGLLFLRILSRAMYSVYQYLATLRERGDSRIKSYIDLSKIGLVHRPYIPEAPFYRSYKARSTSINDYINFYKTHLLQRKALENLVKVLDEHR